MSLAGHKFILARGEGSINSDTPLLDSELIEIEKPSNGDGSALVLTGASLDLSNIHGNTYNYALPLNSTSYSVSTKAINGFARVFINAATEPTVTGGTKLAGADFIPNTTMEMVVETPDGNAVEYYFIER